MSSREKWLPGIQQAAQSGSWKLDIVNNAMKWSEETFRLFGFQPEEISPTLSDYLRQVHVTDQEKVNNFFEEVTKTGEPATIEHRIVINGLLRYLLVQAQVKYDENTNKILLTGSVRDITEQQQNKIKKSKTKKDDTFTKTGRFTQLSYNIRTPLSSIVNLLYLLEKSNFSNQQRELIAGLKTSVDDLSMVLNNLLNYSLFISEDLRVQQEVFNLEELLNNVARSGRLKSEQANLKFNFEGVSSLPTSVIGDESKLQQVLLNLLELAIIHTVGGQEINMEAAPEPGILLVKISYSGIPVTINIPETKEDSELMKMIFDDEPDDKALLPHLSTFIASKLTKLLGGSLTADCQSEEPCLLTFQVGMEAVKREEKSKRKEGLDRMVNVLLVEDHFLNQIATKKVLTSWSDLVKVVTADNGEEALEKFEKETIDLILMDLKIPKISGIEAARTIRKKSDVPIIALTASSSRQEEERCFAVGMNDYIHKPIKPEELHAKIIQLIN